jgi:hypothetical protein
MSQIAGVERPATPRFGGPSGRGKRAEIKNIGREAGMAGRGDWVRVIHRLFIVKTAELNSPL